MRFAIFVVAAFLFLLPAHVALADTDDKIQRGSELYAEFCQGCHGPDHSEFDQFSGDFDDFRRVLEGETEEMPDFFGVFSDAEVMSLYAFLSSSRG
jgi:mono/diheme cytochrome c family protein